MSKEFQKEVFWVNEFSDIYGPCRASVYTLIRKGLLQAFKIGSRTAITRKAAEEWLQRCQAESKGKFKVAANG